MLVRGSSVTSNSFQSFLLGRLDFEVRDSITLHNWNNHKVCGSIVHAFPALLEHISRFFEENCEVLNALESDDRSSL